MSYLNKAADQLLLDRVNEVNDNVFTLEDLSFGPPVVTEENGKNTKFLITPGPRFTPEPNVEYHIWVNRLDVAELFRRYNIDVLEVPVATDTREVAQWIAQTYGLPIIDSDIVENEVGTEGEFDLVFSDTSKILFGTLRCKVAVDDGLYLRDLLKVNILEGFNYPDAVVDHLVKPVQDENADLSAHATKEDGTLVVGQGIPSKGFTVTTNNELELAVSASIARMSEEPRYIQPEDGVYLIELDPEQEWNFLFSASLFNSDVKISDQYEVVLYVLSVDTNERLDLLLTRDTEGNYHWVNEDLGIDISDSVVAEGSDTVQNVQRLSFYAEHFPQTRRGSSQNAAFLGEFEVGLVGYRSNSLTPRVASIIRVVAEEKLVQA